MLLADKERTTQQQPAELDEPAQQHEITSKKIVELSVNAVATQILEMVQNGELFTKSHVERLEAKISEQEKTINELNREIGSLRAQLTHIDTVQKQVATTEV